MVACLWCCVLAGSRLSIGGIGIGHWLGLAGLIVREILSAKICKYDTNSFAEDPGKSSFIPNLLFIFGLWCVR